MKQCPKCNRSYDDSLSFCLMDGTPLTVAEDETVVMRKSPAPKKSKFLLWFGVTVLAILFSGAAAVGLLIYKLSEPGENTQVKRQSNAKISPSPSSTVKVTPTLALANSSPTAETSPKTEDSKPTPDNEDSEEITPIAWETSAGGFKGESGKTYKFRCPEQGAERTIWGSDVYTQDSSICTAAVHAGLFTLAAGGVVTIEFRPGRSTYGSTVRNGIKSNTYGEYPRSFVVR
jgi:hypothetical protein